VVFKLGLLTCAFYFGLTAALEALLWAVAYFWGFGVFVGGTHPALRLGVRFGLLFGILWVISFITAWLIVYHGFQVRSGRFL
jgi:hypothetical protein